MNHPHATMAARAAEEAGFDPSELCTAHYRLFMAGYDAGLTAAQYEAEANAEAINQNDPPKAPRPTGDLHKSATPVGRGRF